MSHSLSTQRKTRTRLAATRKVSPMVSAEDVLKTCRVAANLALRGETYSEHDRSDTTAALVLLVMERAKDDAETWKAPTGDTYFPARLIGMDFLVQRAANERRKLTTAMERTKELESTVSAEDAPTGKLSVHGSSAAPDEASPINDGTPWGARITALNLLADAGLWEGARSGKLAPNVRANVDRVKFPQGHLFDERREVPTTVRAKAPTGPLWTLAYTMARVAGCAMDTEGAMIDNGAVAEELGLKSSAHKMQLKRGAQALAESGHTVGEWMSALNAEGLHWSAPEGAQGMDERTTQKHVDGSVLTRPTAKRTSDRGSEWSKPRKAARTKDGRPVVGGPDRAIDPLPPLKRKALSKATDMRRARLAGLDTDARNTARAAANLPRISA